MLIWMWFKRRKAKKVAQQQQNGQETQEPKTV
jgi:hypothetical protein